MHTFLALHILVLVINRSYQSNLDKTVVAEFSVEVSNSESKEVTENMMLDERNGESKEKVEVTSSRVEKALSIEDFNNADNSTKDESASPCEHRAAAAREEDDSWSPLTNYPFAVSVQRKGAHYTSGAFINKRWILTSAKEYFNVRETIKLFRVRLGSIDCKKGGTVVPIKKIEIHPLYVYGKPNFDVALLQIAQPVIYTDDARPITLSKYTKKVISAKFMTTYWPTLIVNGTPVPSTANERVKHNSMRISTQRLIPKERCLSYLPGEKIHESTHCLKPIAAHHSVCSPDSGAPVVAEDGLWGITSGWISQNCQKTPSPTMFTRVSSLSVRTWLVTQMVE